MCTSMTSTRLADLQKSALYKNAHSAVDCTKSKIIHVASTCWKIGVLSTRPLVSLASWKSPCSSIQICHVLFSAFFLFSAFCLHALWSPRRLANCHVALSKFVPKTTFSLSCYLYYLSVCLCLTSSVPAPALMSEQADMRAPIMAGSTVWPMLGTRSSANYSQVGQTTLQQIIMAWMRRIIRFQKGIDCVPRWNSLCFKEGIIVFQRGNHCVSRRESLCFKREMMCCRLGIILLHKGHYEL